MIECQGCGTKNAKDNSHCRMCGGPLSFDAAFPGRKAEEQPPRPPGSGGVANDSLLETGPSPAGAIFGLIVSVIALALAWQKLAEYSTGAGQFAVAVSKEAADDKSLYQLLVALAVAAAIFCIYKVFSFQGWHSAQEARPEVLLICPGCRNRVPDGQRFCGSCGERLTP